MRVISGQYRSRKLISADGQHTRPTLDRAKETIFNILQPYLSESICLDSFGGSGQIAIEMLSRGANFVTVVDNDSNALKAISTNFSALDIQKDCYEILRGSFATVIPMLKQKYDVVYLDPPYMSNYYQQAIQLLLDNDKLSDNCVVVCECSKTIQLPDQVGRLHVVKQRSSGNVNFVVYRRCQDE